MSSPREERLDPVAADQRGNFQRDRDRLLYSHALMRLGAVTQVVWAGETQVFHNRLTHTMKVAQFGRRLAEWLLQTSASECQGKLDPDVVEAACLAHDLGHPPFGHIGEMELDHLVTSANVPDGYEGNAQAFRIVTRLEIREHKKNGLNLTRAVLNAILKYPWLRSARHPNKWGAYQSEAQEFDWARKGAPADTKTLEAHVMDWADSVTYAVHDLLDFVRAGLIPVACVMKDKAEQKRYLKRCEENGKLGSGRAVLKRLKPFFGNLPMARFGGSRQERAALRQLDSLLVSRYIGQQDRATAPSVNGNGELILSKAHQQEVEGLQELTRQYVISNPALTTQQAGQRRVLRTLFDCYTQAAASLNKHVLFPEFFREQLETGSQDQVRLVADFLSGLTENQAVMLFQRITGHLPGSVLDSI